jgi:hypothetical protein
MNALFKKLNYKGQPTIHVLNAPASLEAELDSLNDEATVVCTLDPAMELEFVMAFVTQQTEIDTLLPLIGPYLKGDALLWMCYPKGTSKKYQCDFNRDTGWKTLGQYGLEGVRMVAIDADWSALRFRKVAYIKKLTRTFGTLSEEGKLKSGQS